jgi:drug/metabolite transporter (DMT)-like permease
VEVVYGALLAAAYRTGDLSHAYPLMRGTAPLLVAVVSGVLIGDHLSATVWIGVVLVSGGVLGTIFDVHREGHPGSATRLALLNAVVIATYTVIDGIGVRRSGHPFAFGLWLFALLGLPWFIWSLIRGLHTRRGWRQQIAFGAVGGCCSVASYTLALWAMTRSPVAAVVAVRETSILFGTLFGALLLRERVTWVRALGAISITGGVLVIRAA